MCIYTYVCDLKEATWADSKNHKNHKVTKIPVLETENLFLNGWLG